MENKMNNQRQTQAPPANPCIDGENVALLSDLDPVLPCNETEDPLGRMLKPEGQCAIIQITGPDERCREALVALEAAGFRRYGPCVSHEADKSDLSKAGIMARGLGQVVYQMAIGIPVDTSEKNGEQN